MGIFDRLKRVARAEISEMKRALSQGDGHGRDAHAHGHHDELDPGSHWAREEAEHARDVAAAERELAREHGELDPLGDALTADIEAGAALWRGSDDAAPAGPAAEAPATPNAAHYESRTHAFSREVRDAYAALELPLGAPRVEIERAFRELVQRYHPDKHAHDARRHALANELTIRIREARDLLLAWLGQS